MDARNSSEYKKYIKYFKGRSIPYTVLVDSSGKAQKDWVGYSSYSQLVGDILKASQT